MSYTKFIMQDAVCNYLNAEVDKSEKMLLSCINYDKFPLESIPVDITKGTCNGQEIVEGFSSDMGIGGVSHVEGNKCPVGHTKVGEKCMQVCTHCTYEDEKGYFGDNQVSNDICGVTGMFDGIDYNGYVKCKQNPYLEKTTGVQKKCPQGYLADSTFDKLSSFFN